MYDNNIGDQGAIAIAKALEFNAVMKTLYLNGNKIGDLGATAIAGALQVNAVLKELRLQHNKIGDSGAIAIAEALKFNAELGLETLYVPGSIKNHPQLIAACREKGVDRE